MAGKTKAKSTGGGISLMAKPSPEVLKKARKMGKLRAAPSKKNRKTLTQVKAFETSWNDWVKYVIEKAKARDEEIAQEEKLKKARAAINGL